LQPGFRGSAEFGPPSKLASRDCEGEHYRPTKENDYGDCPTSAAPVYTSKDAILGALAAGKLTLDDASKRLDALTKSKPSRLYVKVSAKGGVSVYGLQRMPVTLYGQQWERLREFMPEIEAFIAANKDKLSVK
jgi:hypothetical protein